MSEFDLDDFLNNISKETGELLPAVNSALLVVNSKQQETKVSKAQNNEENPCIEPSEARDNKKRVFATFLEEFLASVEEDRQRIRKEKQSQHKTAVSADQTKKQSKTDQLLRTEAVINVAKENIGNNIAVIRGYELNKEITTKEDSLKTIITTAFKKGFQENIPTEALDRISKSTLAAQNAISREDSAILLGNNKTISSVNFYKFGYRNVEIMLENMKDDADKELESLVEITPTSETITEAEDYICKVTNESSDQYLSQERELIIFSKHFNNYNNYISNNVACTSEFDIKNDVNSQKTLYKEKELNSVKVFLAKSLQNDAILMLTTIPSYNIFRQNKMLSAKIVKYASSDFYKRFLKKFTTAEEKWKQKHAEQLAKLAAEREAVENGELVIKPRITLYSLKNSKRYQLEQAINPSAFEERVRNFFKKRDEENKKYAEEHKLKPEQITAKRRQIFDGLDQINRDGIRCACFALVVDPAVDKVSATPAPTVVEAQKRELTANNNRKSEQTLGEKLRLKISKAAQDNRLAGVFLQFCTRKVLALNNNDKTNEPKNNKQTNEKYVYVVLIEGASYSAVRYIHSVLNFLANYKLVSFIEFIDVFDTFEENFDEKFLKSGQKWFYIKNYKSYISSFLKEDWGRFSTTIADVVIFLLTKSIIYNK